RTATTAHLEAVARDERPAFPTFQPPYREALEALTTPTLIVMGGRQDDATDRFGVYANAAARQLLRMGEAGARLITLIRDPDVLAAVDAALYAGQETRAPLVITGAASRQLVALAKPLASDTGARLALLTLEDETEARRSEQARVDFLANASHELRTPLASLSGFIETLRGHAKDDPAARDRFLDIMQAQADRMFRLVADLTSLSRIEQSEHLPPSEAVDLAAAASDVLDALAPVAAERQVKLELIPPDQPAVVVGERDQIIQVVQNLAENAIKYSPAGETVTVTVEGSQTATWALRARRGNTARLPLLTPDREGDAYACVRVEDRGGGIARENLPRLTERFYRVEGQKSGERLGTGLGLAIVKHIVNRHRGGMAVESAVGAGATFSVCLPLARNAEAL
ncbi:MAG TPA: ATP-binding protein, partial [Phenylobacterium sp.]|nr:ATP-binding protein [Phenylobacterium sp.]